MPLLRPIMAAGDFGPAPEELEAGAEVLRASGIVERINGGQEWEPVHRVSGYRWQKGAEGSGWRPDGWTSDAFRAWSWTECDEPRRLWLARHGAT